MEKPAPIRIAELEHITPPPPPGILPLTGLPTFVDQPAAIEDRSAMMSVINHTVSTLHDVRELHFSFTWQQSMRGEISIPHWVDEIPHRRDQPPGGERGDKWTCSQQLRCPNIPK